MTPTKSKYTILAQLCNLIPAGLVGKLARRHGVDKQARSFSPWSHIVMMILSQTARSLSLNDIIDAARNHVGKLLRIRGATPPSKNGLSHANKIRHADMAEDLFWAMVKTIQMKHPTFGNARKYIGLPFRFTANIFAIDSTTIKLVANCMDWAKHRRQKAAAKTHMLLDLNTFLPKFAIVKEASTHDATEAWPLCRGLKRGEIALFDKAYVDFKHLYHLSERGVFWVTRAKDNMAFRVVGQQNKPKGHILADVLIELTGKKSAQRYPQSLRMVIARVDVNGKEKVMSFITNNTTWAGSSVCDLYQARWGIEVFFKEIKQTMQLTSFFGQSKNAIRWQVWTALLTYLLLRYARFLSGAKLGFARLFTLIRGVLFDCFDMFSVLHAVGQPRGRPAEPLRVNQAILPGLSRFLKSNT